MSPPSTVSAIVPTLDRRALLLELLTSLAQQTRLPDEIVVICQDGAPAPDDLPATVAQRLRWIVTPPSSPAAARNQGARESTGELLLFLEDDIQVPDRHFVAHHLRWYGAPPVDGVHGAVCQAGEQLPATPELPADATAADWLIRSPNCRRRQTAVGLAGGNLSLRRQLFDAVGGFDERFGRAEDKDLGLRLFRAGAVMLHDPEAMVVHLRAPGGTRDRRSLADRWRGLFRPEPHPGELLLHLVHFPGRPARGHARRRLGKIWSGRGLLAPHRAAVRTLRLVRSWRVARRLARQPGPEPRS